METTGTTTTQTGRQIKATQVIVPEWLESTIEAGGGDDASFTVTREVTGFGTFLASVEAVGR